MINKQKTCSSPIPEIINSWDYVGFLGSCVCASVHACISKHQATKNSFTGVWGWYFQFFFFLLSVNPYRVAPYQRLGMSNGWERATRRVCCAAAECKCMFACLRKHPPPPAPPPPTAVRWPQMQKPLEIRLKVASIGVTQPA